MTLDVTADTIQSFPTYSEIYLEGVKALRTEMTAGVQTVGAGAPTAT